MVQLVKHPTTQREARSGTFSVEMLSVRHAQCEVQSGTFSVEMLSVRHACSQVLPQCFPRRFLV